MSLSLSVLQFSVVLVTQHPALSVPSFRAQIDSDLDETGSCSEECRPHFKIATYEQQRHPSKLRKTLNQSQIQKYTKQGLYQLTVGNTDLILLGVFFSGGHF